MGSKRTPVNGGPTLYPHGDSLTQNPFIEAGGSTIAIVPMIDGEPDVYSVTIDFADGRSRILHRVTSVSATEVVNARGTVTLYDPANGDALYIL